MRCSNLPNLLVALAIAGAAACDAPSCSSDDGATHEAQAGSGTSDSGAPGSGAKGGAVDAGGVGGSVGDAGSGGDAGNAVIGGSGGSIPGSAGGVSGAADTGTAGAGGGGEECPPPRVGSATVSCCNGVPCRGVCDGGECVCFDMLGGAIEGGCDADAYCCALTSARGCFPVSELDACFGGPP